MKKEKVIDKLLKQPAYKKAKVKQERSGEKRDDTVLKLIEMYEEQNALLRKQLKEGR
jgi:PDZ domain-containing secreted protein